jgi:hypothetical protein
MTYKINTFAQKKLRTTAQKSKLRTNRVGNYHSEAG